MKILESDDWLTYSSAWNECMKNYYWYQNRPVFDWNKDEELDEMESDFGKPGSVFLEAHDDGKVVGVFSFRYRGKQANLNRWEPAVVASKGASETRKEMLDYALNYLSQKGVERTRVTIKYPSGNSQVAQHLLDLYIQSGFIRYQPDSVDLVTSLNDIPNPPSMQTNVVIDPHQGTNPENIGKWCVRAYGSTPEDLEIHEFDKSVTDYETAVAAMKSIMGGRLGDSPEEFWKVALVDSKPAGFIGGFILKNKHNPVTGVLGPLGVFPEFRRLGLGVFLISELFKSMKSYECEYTAVGTPSVNTNAIRMYQKAGYKMNCYLSFLEKSL